jgi:hypothetical protein
LRLSIVDGVVKLRRAANRNPNGHSAVVNPCNRQSPIGNRE